MDIKLLNIIVFFLQRIDGYTGHFETIDKDGQTLECEKCPMGTHLGVKCTTSMRTICHPCQEGTYTNQPTQANKCARCSAGCYDDIHAEVISNCTATRDLHCKCRTGYHARSQKSNCYLHRQCSIGYGVLRKGIYQTDTDCAEHLASPKLGSIKNRFGTRHFVKQLVRKQ